MGSAEGTDSPAPFERTRASVFAQGAPNRVSILATLKKIPLFQDLTKKEIRQIEEILYPRTYRPDEFVFRQGEPALGMYIIHKGSVWIQRADASDPAAVQSTLERGPGDFFGEMSLLEEQVHTVSAKARTCSVVLGFFRPDFTILNHDNPCLGSKLLLALGRLISRRSLASPAGSREESSKHPVTCGKA